MKALHVVGRLGPGSGLAEAVVRMAAGLNQTGVTVTLATIGEPAADSAGRCAAAGVRLQPFPASQPGVAGYSFAMQRGLGALARAADVVHVHGAWSFPVWWGCRAAAGNNKPLVRSPHGSFQPAALQKSAWRKQIVGRVIERRLLRQAAVVHATAEHEAAALRTYGFTGTIAVVPNAVDCHETGARDDSPRTRIDARCSGCRDKRYILMLSRLHPTKGLDLLIEAWRRVAPAFPGWHLLIAGPPGGAYQAAMERQAARLGLLASLTFCGPLYERDKDAALRHAAVLVLPSRSENFGLSAAEALACGVPVITTRGTPWAGVVGARDPAVPEPFPDGIAAGRCGWWVEASADGLAGALREAMGLDAATRRAMGAEGQRWVRHALDVQRIAVRMRLVYEACLPGPPPRACPARLPS